MLHSLLLVNQTPFKKRVFHGWGLFFMVKIVVLTLPRLLFDSLRSTDTIGSRVIFSVTSLTGFWWGVLHRRTCVDQPGLFFYCLSFFEEVNKIITFVKNATELLLAMSLLAVFNMVAALLQRFFLSSVHCGCSGDRKVTSWWAKWTEKPKDPLWKQLVCQTQLQGFISSQGCWDD